MINSVRRIRDERSLSQEGLAYKTGVSSTTIRGIENGRQAPSVYLALRIARVLEVSVEDLFSVNAEEVPA